MKFQSIRASLFSVFLITTLGACGGSLSSSSSGGGSSGGTTTITSVQSLPAATDAVIDGGSSTSSLVRNLGSSSTGLPFGSLTADDFTSSMSMAACEMFNTVKTAVFQSAQGDLIQCYITSTFDAFADAQNIDIYDNQYHVFALDFSGSSFEEGEDTGGPEKIKFKISKNSSGVITSFEMFSCESGSQSMYLLQTIDGTSFSMQTQNSGSDHGERGGNFSDMTTVTGTLNSSGQFVDEVNGVATPKVVHMKHRYQSDNDNFSGDVLFNQSADSGTVAATFTGSNTFENQSCTFTNLIYGSVGLLNVSPDHSFGEMQNGAVKGEMGGGCGNDTWTDTFTEAWTGADALALDDSTTSSYYSDVSEQTLTEADSFTFSFGSEWDCSDEAEATVVFADLDVDVAAACSDLEGSHEHIDCWHIIGDQVQQEQQQDNGPNLDAYLTDCSTDSDCSELGDSAVCSNAPGYNVCTTSCSQSSDCTDMLGEGAMCLGEENEVKVCVRTCSSDEQCSGIGEATSCISAQEGGLKVCLRGS